MAFVFCIYEPKTKVNLYMIISYPLLHLRDQPVIVTASTGLIYVNELRLDWMPYFIGRMAGHLMTLTKIEKVLAA